MPLELVGVGNLRWSRTGGSSIGARRRSAKRRVLRCRTVRRLLAGRWYLHRFCRWMRFMCLVGAGGRWGAVNLPQSAAAPKEFVSVHPVDHRIDINFSLPRRCAGGGLPEAPRFFSRLLTGSADHYRDIVSMRVLTDLKNSRELIVNLTMREIRGKYKRTALGQFWSLLNPLAAMLIYTLVFAFILRVEPEPGDPSGLNIFALWLLCGLLPWGFLANVLNGGMTALVGNANLVTKVFFPRETLVISVAIAALVTLATELAVLSIALLAFGGNPLPWIPMVIVVMLLFLCFCLGVALVLAVANVYFRDTSHLVGILLQLWLYLTPILYPLSYVTSQFDILREKGIDVPLEFIYRLNPAERYVTVFRQLLYDNRWPDAGDLLFCVVAAAVSLVIGYSVFKRHEARIGEEL